MGVTILIMDITDMLYLPKSLSIFDNKKEGENIETSKYRDKLLNSEL